jgi:maleate isomerase
VQDVCKAAKRQREDQKVPNGGVEDLWSAEKQWSVEGCGQGCGPSIPVTWATLYFLTTKQPSLSGGNRDETLKMAKTTYRIGQIVPSSNTTMETEIPAMLRRRESVAPERFTFHSARMRMQEVNKEELEQMDRQSDRCALELSDARMDVIGYACLVAIMSMGHGYHRESEARLTKIARDNLGPAPVVTSAGALVDGLKHLNARKVAVIAPYVKTLTQLVIDYIENEGIEVKDRIALEIPNNLQVAACDPMAPTELWKRLDVRGVDAIVVSACVQMPSLPSIPHVERASGLPTVSAAACTAFQMLQKLKLNPIAPDAGALLSGTRMPVGAGF